MKYSDLVDINESFQTSINLEYDLNKYEKVKSYIPTEQSVQILGSFLKTYYYNTEKQNRASVLIGPYGRGKSHLLLVLTALTSMDCYHTSDYTEEDAKNLQKELCNKINIVNPEIGSLATAICESGIRTLPIVINSNTNDINQAFLVAIKEALDKSGLEDILPDTYFDAAIEVLDKWSSGYPKVIKQLSLELKKSKKSFDDLYTGLKQFDQEAYTDFCRIYPIVAAGTSFNPLSNMDVVKLYLAVVDTLCENTEYSGINIIFDEFSKFLEANIDSSKMLNFKIIQDMAEASTRSGKNQIHFTCITHKDILDYSSNDSFKAVEGRFNKIRYIASSEQSYELISNAIPKKAEFEKYYLNKSSVFENALNVASVVNVFESMTQDRFEKKVIKGCFPLAPLSAFSLLHVSEMVGQNERTLFTFLAKNERYSLPDFMLNHDNNDKLVTIDNIYDYFQELFRKEVFNSAVHSIWTKTDTALRQAKKEHQRRVLKAIAIIYMIGDERFKTIPAHIKASLLMDDNEFEDAVSGLKKKHIISQRDSSEYVLLTANGVDVQKNVENYVNSKISRINCSEILHKNLHLGYVIPREYNDRYSMMRFYKKIFMEADVFINYPSGEILLEEYRCDGLLIYILDNEDKKEIVLNHLSNFITTPEIIVCLSTYKYDFEGQLKKIVAIQQLKNTDLVNDPHYLEEIEYYEEDITKQIASSVDLAYSPISRYSKYYNSKEILDIVKQSDLNHVVTRICMERYSKTPIVNNEMVNKRTLNSQNLKGRNIAVDWVLNHYEDEEIPCMDGYGPEVSIFKAMYVFTGLAKSEQTSDIGMHDALECIKRFIESSEGENKKFIQLYNELEKPPFGIRKGIIPLLIAYVFRRYKNDIFIYFKGKEVELNSAVLSGINDSPYDYELLLEKGTIEREEYIDYLLKLFSDYSDVAYVGTNRAFAVIKNMQVWMRSLPEYTKKFSKYYSNGEIIDVDANTNIIRNDLLKFELNAREVLFINWREKLGINDDYLECEKEIKRIKKFLDNHIINYKNSLIKYLMTMFMPGYSGTLSQAMNLWYEKLPETTKKHVFDSEANGLLQLAENWTSYDDQRLLVELSMLFVSMSIEDWTDSLSEKFYHDIENTIKRINDYIETSNDKDECNLEINLPGIHVNKSFTETKVSPLGQTVLNNLKAVFEEYNESIESDEQLAIIAELIRDVIR